MKKWRKRKFSIIIISLIIITSIFLIYNHNKTTKDNANSNTTIQKVQSEKGYSRNNDSTKNKKVSENNSNKETSSVKKENKDSKINDNETSTVIKNNSSKNLDQVKNLK